MPIVVPLTIKTSNGSTCAISIQAGVKQGCPLSPILLNLSIDTLTLTSTKQRATFAEQRDFIIWGNHIPALSQEESYCYLGIPIRLIDNIDDIPSIVPNLIKHIECPVTETGCN